MRKSRYILTSQYLRVYGLVFLWRFYYIKDLTVAQKTESNRWRFNVEFAQKTLNTKVAEWNDGVSFDKTNKISLN